MTSKKPEQTTTVRILVIVFGAIVILSILALIELYVYDSLHTWENRGLFGDMFGVGNAIFSALAFGGVILAILLQQEGLKLQHKDLAFARNEVKIQGEQLQIQAETLKKQNRENTFFQLLRFHQEILQSITYNRKGRGAIAEIVVAFRNEYDNKRHRNASLDDLGRIQATHKRFHDKFHSHVGHYFRNLYHILKFIDESPATEEEKKLYGRLVRAQLSSDELVLLFYNCLSNVGVEKFKPLVEKFAMLQHVPKKGSKGLIDPGHTGLYDYRAYGEAVQN